MQRRVEEITYTLTRKQVKNLNLRVRPDGSVAVSAPRRVPLEAVDSFVARHLPLIRRARQRLAALPGYLTPPDRLCPGGSLWLFGAQYPLSAGDGGIRLEQGRILLPPGDPLPYTHRQVGAFLREQLRPQVDLLLERYLPRFIPRALTAPGAVTYRSMRARYGSCNTRTGQITLSTRLAHLPPDAVEYVVVHELAHLVVPDHSPGFYRTVAAVLPDYRRRIALLGPGEPPAAVPGPPDTGCPPAPDRRTR